MFTLRSLLLAVAFACGLLGSYASYRRGLEDGKQIEYQKMLSHGFVNVGRMGILFSAEDHEGEPVMISIDTVPDARGDYPMTVRHLTPIQADNAYEEWLERYQL